MSNLKKTLIVGALIAFPSFAFAEQITDLQSLVRFIVGILNSLIPLLFAVAVIGFIWGFIRYLYSESPEKISEARNFIIFCVIAIAVMASVWGLALMVKNTFFPNDPVTLQKTGQDLQTSTKTAVPRTAVGKDAYPLPSDSTNTGSGGFWSNLFHTIFGN